MTKRQNLLYKAFQSTWMMDAKTAGAAFQLFNDMVGAARLKAKYSAIEYDLLEDDDFDYEDTYYNFRLTNKEYPAIPVGKHVNVVRVEGVMMRDEGLCQPGTRQLADWLCHGDADSRVIANILLVDSGGGASDSVKDLADAIGSCSHPVIAFCDGYMCSAAYYVASYCKHIMANDGRNLVGCIGTMIELAGTPKNFTDQDGVVHVRIYADGSEDKNNDYEEALKGNIEPIKQQLLNPLAEDFRNAVEANRPASLPEQRKGRTFFAQDVVGTLIDSIGSFAEAVDKAIELSNINITTMEGYNNIQSIASCADLQQVDEMVTLNAEQLGAIDAQLATLSQERDQFKAEAEKVANLTQEIDSLKETVSQKDARIAALESAINKAQEEEAAAQAMHNGNPAKPEDEFQEATDEEAAEYARKVVNGEL